jgi:Tfp pilus assembly protein PilN
MRAVNLIPADERSGAGGAAGRSGGAAYVLIAVLGLLVVMAAAYATAGKTIKSRTNELASVRSQADSAEATATQLVAYTQFADMRTKRVQTVRSIADSRFDWSQTLHEIARVIPSNVWLTSLSGTVTAGAKSAGGGGSSTGALRSDLPLPAVEIVGCTTTQNNVARMMARMRLIDGVQRVSLGSATKGNDDVPSSGSSGSGDAASGGGNSGDCRGASSKFPQFEMVVFFTAPATPSAAATTTPPTGATIPAASTTTTSTPAPATTTPAPAATATTTTGSTP